MEKSIDSLRNMLHRIKNPCIVATGSAEGEKREYKLLGCDNFSYINISDSELQQISSEVKLLNICDCEDREKIYIKYHDIFRDYHGKEMMNSKVFASLNEIFKTNITYAFETVSNISWTVHKEKYFGENDTYSMDVYTVNGRTAIVYTPFCTEHGKVIVVQLDKQERFRVAQLNSNEIIRYIQENDL